MGYLAARPLRADDRVEGFDCRSSEQTTWLVRHAKQSASSNLTKVFVVTQEDDDQAVACCAWTMAQLQLADAPGRLVRGAGRYPQPVALLARLGVDQRHEGRSLGAGLLRDVIARLMLVSADIGCRGLLVHAESDDARSFYPHLIPELQESPTDRMHPVLLMKDALPTFGGSSLPPGIDLSSGASLREVMDQGSSSDERR